MTKYIEIEEAEKAFREAFKSPSEMGNAQAFINILRHDVPAADVKPVVRGTWIEIERGPDGRFETNFRVKCSICGRVRVNPDILYFCPNCGADMRKENE